jgi:hypothetical protein
MGALGGCFDLMCVSASQTLFSWCYGCLFWGSGAAYVLCACSLFCMDIPELCLSFHFHRSPLEPLDIQAGAGRIWGFGNLGKSVYHTLS